jgi:hypothetical protein
MRHLLTALLVPPLLGFVPPAAQAAGTCQGQPATLEASGGTVTGTPGNDVILVTGRADVDALGGNDVVCVVGGTLVAGPGDDRVEMSGNANQQTNLGPGDDWYNSTGNAPDLVDFGSGGDSSGRDTISTGIGATDAVASGVVGEPNFDTIDLGPQGDFLDLRLPAGSNAQVSGGPADETGGGSLLITVPPDDPTPWSVQLPNQFSRAGASLGTFSGFDNVQMNFGPTTPVTVRGTSGDDRISLSGGLPDVDMGAGHDSVHLAELPSDGRVVGGNGGDDYLSVDSSAELRVNNARGKLGALAMDGFNVFTLVAPTVHFLGNKRADTVRAMGCAVTLRGGVGNDLLSYASEDWRPALPDCDEYRFRIYGQAGNDQLDGWRGRDKLIGGPGHDEANGRHRRDVCRAEVERRCER